MNYKKKAWFVTDNCITYGYKDMNILVRRSRRSGVARATIPDLGSHHLLLI